MKANELRVGNYLQIEGKCYEFELSDFHSLYQDKIDFGKIDLYPFEPIPLTEEWLIKFGFESIYETKDEFRFTDNKEGFRLELSEYFKNDGRAVFYYNKPYKNENHTCIAYCKYVHQLQNLYFALTGDELNETIH